MNIRDELIASFGEDFFTRTASRSEYHNWTTVCVCGHIAKFHSPDIGGEFGPVGTTEVTRRGETWTTTQEFTGCIGALKPRDVDIFPATIDREARSIVTTVTPTCPCTEMRPVVNVDRPNRYFNQRIPKNLHDQDRHPFLIGIRALTTHLSKRKAAQTDPDWATEEFARRFVWIEGKRRCAISRCEADPATVWPSFITDDGLSELRCAAHR